MDLVVIYITRVSEEKVKRGGGWMDRWIGAKHKMRSNVRQEQERNSNWGNRIGAGRRRQRVMIEHEIKCEGEGGGCT